MDLNGCRIRVCSGAQATYNHLTRVAFEFDVNVTHCLYCLADAEFYKCPMLMYIPNTNKRFSLIEIKTVIG